MSIANATIVLARDIHQSETGTVLFSNTTHKVRNGAWKHWKRLNLMSVNNAYDINQPCERTLTKLLAGLCKFVVLCTIEQLKNIHCLAKRWLKKSLFTRCVGLQFLVYN